MAQKTTGSARWSKRDIHIDAHHANIKLTLHFDIMFICVFVALALAMYVLFLGHIPMLQGKI